MGAFTEVSAIGFTMENGHHITWRKKEKKKNLLAKEVVGGGVGVVVVVAAAAAAVVVVLFCLFVLFCIACLLMQVRSPTPTPLGCLLHYDVVHVLTRTDNT